MQSVQLKMCQKQFRDSSDKFRISLDKFREIVNFD